MDPKFRNPLEGHPRTVETVDAVGLPTFRITPHVLTPGRAKAADKISFVLFCLLWMGCLYSVATAPRWDLTEAATTLATGLAGGWVIRWVTHYALRRRTEIEMSADTIAVRGWLGWRRYSRLMEHRFALHIHDSAAQEYRNNDYLVREAATKGRVLNLPAYYGSSFHVVMVYAGHRLDLLTVFGQVEAAAVVSRLQYCDRRLNEALEMGRGAGERPENDWYDAAGGMNHG